MHSFYYEVASLWWLSCKEFACSAGDTGSTHGLGRSPGEGNGNPLQYFCLENPHGPKSLVGCSPWGQTESDTTEWLSTALFILFKTWPGTLPLPKNLILDSSASDDGWVPHIALWVGADDFTASSSMPVPGHSRTEIRTLLSITFPLFFLYITWFILSHSINFSNCYSLLSGMPTTASFIISVYLFLVVYFGGYTRN